MEKWGLKVKMGFINGRKGLKNVKMGFKNCKNGVKNVKKSYL